MRFLYLAALLGGGLFVAVNLWAGWREVAQSVEAIGWGVALIIGVRLLVTIAGGLALKPLTDIFSSVSLMRCIAIRWVRDAVNNLLPVAQVGGEIVGARLLARAGMAFGPAGASVLVDFSMQVASQLVFTFVGLGLLLELGIGGEIVKTALIGLLIFTPAVAGFFLVQRKGGLQFVESGLKRIAARFWPQSDSAGEAASVSDSADVVYGRRWAVAQAFIVHLFIWFLGSAEVAIGLWFLGHSVDFSSAVVIESLGQAVKGAAFSVPGAVGVQEGGFVVLCAIFGVSAPAAIALSLAKRAPEIIMGLAGLIYWRMVERRGHV